MGKLTACDRKESGRKGLNDSLPVAEALGSHRQQLNTQQLGRATNQRKLEERQPQFP